MLAFIINMRLRSFILLLKLQASENCGNYFWISIVLSECFKAVVAEVVEKSEKSGCSLIAVL